MITSKTNGHTIRTRACAVVRRRRRRRRSLAILRPLRHGRFPILRRRRHRRRQLRHRHATPQLRVDARPHESRGGQQLPPFAPRSQRRRPQPHRPPVLRRAVPDRDVIHQRVLDHPVGLLLDPKRSVVDGATEDFVATAAAHAREDATGVHTAGAALGTTTVGGLAGGGSLDGADAGRGVVGRFGGGRRFGLAVVSVVGGRVGGRGQRLIFQGRRGIVRSVVVVLLLQLISLGGGFVRGRISIVYYEGFALGGASAFFCWIFWRRKLICWVLCGGRLSSSRTP
mmetsp:Transcript_36308/g.67436  ORF Transcript_36308/g.67436 Transcript_36308/m.67436 type:complete len:283 (-) Transcript_36308:74-922(-)